MYLSIKNDTKFRAALYQMGLIIFLLDYGLYFDPPLLSSITDLTIHQ